MSEDGDDELFEFENISITRHGDRGGTSSQSGVSTAGQYVQSASATTAIDLNPK